jgi:hypothetical protein
VSATFGAVTDGLEISAGLDPVLLFVVRVVGLDHRLLLKVPAFPALRSAERLGPLRARGARAGEGVPARHQHRLGLSGVQVGSAELHGPDAAAVVDGELAHDLAGQRRGEPFGTGTASGHSVSLSPGTMIG